MSHSSASSVAPIIEILAVGLFVYALWPWFLFLMLFVGAVVIIPIFIHALWTMDQ